MIKKLVLTSDKSNWALKGFFHQWSKYCGEPITVVGFTKPDFDLPDYADFYSIGRFKDYPAHKWSNGILKALDDLNPEKCLIMLEDYWLTRFVSPYTFEIAEYVMQDDTILRFDLTSDRLYCASIHDRYHAHHVDVFEADHIDDYHVSLQAGVWNVKNMRRILIPDESPWGFELMGTKRTEGIPNLRVFGQRQWLVQYQIVVQAGNFIKDGSWMSPPRYISEQDWRQLEANGCLPK